MAGQVIFEFTNRIAIIFTFADQQESRLSLPGDYWIASLRQPRCHELLHIEIGMRSERAPQIIGDRITIGMLLEIVGEAGKEGWFAHCAHQHQE